MFNVINDNKQARSSRCQRNYSVVLSYGRKLMVQLVSDLWDDKHEGTDGSINVKFGTLDTDLFEQNEQIKVKD